MKYVIFLFVVILAVVRFSVKFENGIYKLKVTIFPVVPDRLAYIGWIVILGFCLFDLVSGAKPQTQMEQIAKNAASVLIVFQPLVNIFTRCGNYCKQKLMDKNPYKREEILHPLVRLSKEPLQLSEVLPIVQ